MLSLVVQIEEEAQWPERYFVWQHASSQKPLTAWLQAGAKQVPPRNPLAQCQAPGRSPPPYHKPAKMQHLKGPGVPSPSASRVEGASPGRDKMHAEGNSDQENNEGPAVKQKAEPALRSRSGQPAVSHLEPAQQQQQQQQHLECRRQRCFVATTQAGPACSQSWAGTSGSLSAVAAPCSAECHQGSAGMQRPQSAPAPLGRADRLHYASLSSPSTLPSEITVTRPSSTNSAPQSPIVARAVPLHDAVT